MEKINKTLFYKRDTLKNISMLRNIKNLKVGDIIIFYGKLYDSKKYTKKIAKTIIQYKILLITPIGVVIQTSNKYIFNNGTLHFMGNIFSPNFDIKDNVIDLYTVKTSVLSFVEGTQKFRNAFGFSKYKITGNGQGKIIIDIELISKLII